MKVVNLEPIYTRCTENLLPSVSTVYNLYEDWLCIHCKILFISLVFLHT